MLGFLIIPAIYFLLLMWVFYYWLRENTVVVDNNQSGLKISVIVAFRNEEFNLEKLLQQFVMQHPKNEAEFILVDDHSEDGGTALLSSIKKEYPDLDIKTLSLPYGELGKKAALKLGASEATGDILAFTDADVLLPENWLDGILTIFMNRPKTKLFCGPVSISYDKGFLNAFQSLEYGTLMITGIASLKAAYPLLASGANLAIRRGSLLQLGHDPWRSGLSSGDDVFLLHRSFKEFGKDAVLFSQSPRLLVQAHAVSGWKHFLSQRIRWAGKTTASASGFTYLIGFLIVLTNLFAVLSIPLVINGSIEWPMVFWIWGIKVAGESLLALAWSWFSGQLKALKWLPLMALIYPFINLVVFFLSLFIKPSWKGRKVVSKS